jgi:hypothetical protein
MVTVPSCNSCNNGSSADDECLRNAVSFAAGMSTQEANELWTSRTLPGIRRNQRLHKQILRGARRYPQLSRGGIYVGSGFMFQVEAEPIHRAIKRAVRGLYLHSYGCRLLPSTAIDILLLDRHGHGFQSWLNNLVPQMHLRTIGNDHLFEYLFGRVPESPQDSIWLLHFYSSYLIAAFTKPLVPIEATSFLPRHPSSE